MLAELPDLTPLLASVREFLNAGGEVLSVISAALLLLWILLLERWFYLLWGFPAEARHLAARWAARRDRSSWYAAKIREAWLAGASLQLGRHMRLISTLIKLCPLLGLLGTVTGMITVFEVVSLHGTGNPRLMASGISLATIPTLAGLVCALSGLLVFSRLERRGQRLLHRLNLKLEQG